MPSITPKNDKGITEIITNGKTAELNIRTNIKKISKTATTKASFKSFINSLLVFAAPPIIIVMPSFLNFFKTFSIF